MLNQNEMKKIVFFMVIMFFSLSIVVGQKPFRELSDIYKQQKQYFVTELNKKTISLYIKEKNPGSEARDVLEKIDGLKVLSFTMSGVDNIPIFLDDVYSKYRLIDYQPFRVDKSTYENRLIFVKESGDYYSELLLVNTSMADVSVIEINGKIDLEKISLLKNVININGLDVLSGVNDKKGKPADEKNNKGEKTGIKICNKNGVELIGTNTEPSILINGYESKEGLKASLSHLNPDCIQSINVLKGQESEKHGHPNGLIEVQLKGNNAEIFTVCEGVLIFGQNGYIQTIKIDDDCSPNLLVDCSERPLSDIAQMKPQEIKSIQLTRDPRNCRGKLTGEYIVLETK